MRVDIGELNGQSDPQSSNVWFWVCWCIEKNFRQPDIGPVVGDRVNSCLRHRFVNDFDGLTK